jgi:phosphoserine aminotransferase
VNTGEWSKKAIKEARRYCAVSVAASSEDRAFTYVPEAAGWKLDPDAAFVHEVVKSISAIDGVLSVRMIAVPSEV